MPNYLLRNAMVAILRVSSPRHQNHIIYRLTTDTDRVSPINHSTLKPNNNRYYSKSTLSCRGTTVRIRQAFSCSALHINSRPDVFTSARADKISIGKQQLRLPLTFSDAPISFARLFTCLLL